MSKKILISVVPEETCMALVEDGHLLELVIERNDRGHIVGNIYKGRVKNVLPGMQAAFVDIGLDKNAFLYTGGGLVVKHDAFPKGENLSIGREILVQIIKDAIGSKGPRATTYFTIPGQYAVLMPTADYIGVSRRIESTAERERLKNIADKLRMPGTGLILRTAAEGKDERELGKEIEYLYRLWNAITARSKRSGAPALLYRDLDLTVRVVRDYLSEDLDEFVVDNKEAFTKVVDLLKCVSPELAGKVRLIEDGQGIFARYGLYDEIEKLGQRMVWLKSGGYIVIDKTEALTVIDVNTGKYVGHTNLSETVFRTNMEAAEEIAKQIRLRDIGGIIIVDFIDMNIEAHRQAVLDVLENKFKQDRTKTKVIGITELGLVEITRKKSRQNIETVLYSECPHCKGRGRVQSPQTVAINIGRKLRELKKQHTGHKEFIIQTHPTVAALFGHSNLKTLEKELSFQLTIEAVYSMHPESFSILLGK